MDVHLYVDFDATDFTITAAAVNVCWPNDDSATNCRHLPTAEFGVNQYEQDGQANRKPNDDFLLVATS